MQILTNVPMEPTTVMHWPTVLTLLEVLSATAKSDMRVMELQNAQVGNTKMELFQYFYLPYFSTTTPLNCQL